MLFTLPVLKTVGDRSYYITAMRICVIVKSGLYLLKRNDC